MTALSGQRRPSSIRSRAIALATPAVPAAVVIFLSFRAGGYFAGTTALCVVIALIAVVLVLQVARRPFEGVGSSALVPVGCLVALAAWALASSGWSHAAARAVIDSDRYLLYALLVALGAAAYRRPGRLEAAVAGVALAIIFVGGAGAVSRLLPDILSTAVPRNPDRLAFPLTYWNGLGVLAAAGVLLCLGLTSDGRTARWLRAVSAAGVPLLALTLYLTLARGAIVALAAGLVALLVVGRSRRLAIGALATLPPTVVLVVVAYGRDLVSSARYASAAGAHQGHKVALVLLGCVIAAALLRIGLEPLERRFVAWTPARAPSRRAVSWSAAVLVVLAVGAALALDAPHAIAHGFKRFADASPVSDARSRLTSFGNNGRIAHWRVAVDTFRDHPLDGSGAGTYATQWARHRHTSTSVLHAHSAYLGVLSDLGLPGALLLVVAVVALLAGFAARARAPGILLPAAAFAAALTWALHAGIDWDLEMPATGAWVFMLGGMALARPAPATTEDAAPRGALGGTLRLVLGVAALALAIMPARVAFSQAQIGSALADFEHNDCPAAIDRALSARDTLSLRPEPYEVLGFCDVRLGSPRLAVTVMQKAVVGDPDWWESRYALALARGAAGLDPRPAATVARRLNPLSELTKTLSERLRTARTPAQWRRIALSSDLPPT